MFKISLKMKNTIRKPEGNIYKIKAKLDHTGNLSIEKKCWPPADAPAEQSIEEKISYQVSPQDARAFRERLDIDAVLVEEGIGHGNQRWTVTLEEGGVKTKASGFVENTLAFATIVDDFESTFRLPETFVLD